MNARDLLTALNDIDPKLLEDVDPWGTPAKKVHHGPWVAAVAAVLAVCVGIGGWLFLAQPQTATPELKDTVSQTSHLDFAENNTGSGQCTSWVFAEDGDTERALTEEELSSLAEQDGLSWMEGYQLSGTSYISSKGEVSWMMIRGFLGKEDQGMDTFVLYLQPSELPRCEARDVCSFLESANNQVNDTDVWAAVTHSGRGYVDPETQESFSDDGSTYWTMFQQADENSTGVALGVWSDQWGIRGPRSSSPGREGHLPTVGTPRCSSPFWIPRATNRLPAGDPIRNRDYGAAGCLISPGAAHETILPKRNPRGDLLPVG